LNNQQQELIHQTINANIKFKNKSYTYDSLTFDLVPKIDDETSINELLSQNLELKNKIKNSCDESELTSTVGEYCEIMRHLIDSNQIHDLSHSTNTSTQTSISTSTSTSISMNYSLNIDKKYEIPLYLYSTKNPIFQPQEWLIKYEYGSNKHDLFSSYSYHYLDKTISEYIKTQFYVNQEQNGGYQIQNYKKKYNKYLYKLKTMSE
jgi:hypothetical protein